MAKLDDAAPIAIVTPDDTPEVEAPTGFLPIETNWFDRCFISVVVWVAISLLWFRFLEPLGLSIWIGTALSLVLAVVIVRKG